MKIKLGILFFSISIILSSSQLRADDYYNNDSPDNYPEEPLEANDYSNSDLPYDQNEADSNEAAGYRDVANDQQEALDNQQNTLEYQEPDSYDQTPTEQNLPSEYINNPDY